ncbi:hypothetical protein BDV24DRAFT_156706 [Aspergillus arachidicola]|uniref:2-dehydropantoate 2-reductase n=1 Tax=Aspergillus arachidicola TaxID=656916 RepID=A0A5N6XPJ8_9EURO|nr:hypothetical protein BDV24DRAFT_156706 [Aspergillus arachidicola]
MADTIHLLGLGSVGVLVAHALAGVQNRPHLNLLFHRPINHPPSLLAVTREGVTQYESNFSAEEYRDGCWYQASSDISSNEDPIHLLVVTVKAHHTLSSIRLVKHRLTHHSTVLFLQNGLGVLDELDAEIFPDPSKRPCYMSGIVTHCVHRKAFLSAVHTATGSIALGASPRITRASEAAVSHQLNTNGLLLVDTLCRTPFLYVSRLSPPTLLEQQLIKLATNSTYNPLTSLLECSVRALITSNSPQVQAISDALVCEFSAIISCLPLAGLISDKDVEEKFSTSNLKRIITQLGLRAGTHTTSMLQDIQNGVQTEIMYLNGYFTRWALSLGIACPTNKIITQMVLAKE